MVRLRAPSKFLSILFLPSFLVAAAIFPWSGPNKQLGCSIAHAQGTCGSNGGPIFTPQGSGALDQDAGANSGSPTTPDPSSTSVVIGNTDNNPFPDGANEQVALIHFPTTDISPNAGIIHLNIPLFRPNALTFVPSAHAASYLPNSVISLKLTRVTTAFNEQTATWNTLPVLDSSGMYTQTVRIPAFKLLAYSPTSATFNVTRYVKDVQAGTIANTGFLLSAFAADESFRGSSFTVSFYSRESNAEAKPRLIITQAVPSTGPTPPEFSPTPFPSPSPSSSSTPTSSPSPTPTSSSSPVPSGAVTLPVAL